MLYHSGQSGVESDNRQPAAIDKVNRPIVNCIGLACLFNCTIPSRVVLRATTGSQLQ